MKADIIDFLQSQKVIDLITKTTCDWFIEVANSRIDSISYISNLCLDIEKCLSKDSNSFEYKKRLNDIHIEIEKLKVFFFKQRKILMGISQRTKHPNYPAPNLGGFSVPQNYRVKGELAIGLGHCEARTFLVKKALEDPTITDILFIDDDILLPLDAITQLCDSREPIIGANYAKKKYPLESVALRIKETDNVIHNQEVKMNQDDLVPQKVSQMGLGALLVSVEVFKKIPEPWFEFVFNQDCTIFAGEDVRFIQKAIIANFSPKIIPGLVPAHVDFKTGNVWGPDWLIKDHKLREEFTDHYCYFLCDPIECDTEDVVKVF